MELGEAALALEHGEKSKFNAELVQDALWMLNAQVLVGYANGEFWGIVGGFRHSSCSFSLSMGIIERLGELTQSLEAFEHAEEIAENNKDREAMKAVKKAVTLLRKR